MAHLKRRDDGGHTRAPAEDLQSLNRRLHKVVSQLKTLYHMGHDLAENENWSDALDRFLMMLVGFMEAEGAALLLFSSNESVLAPRSTFHVDPDTLETASRTLLGGWRAHPRSAEIHSLESYTSGNPTSCLERTNAWRMTAIPLRHRSKPLGFLVMEKHYANGYEFKWDYDFLNTLQTIFAEEIANATYISELRQLGRFNNKVLDNIRSGVITTDLEGVVRYCNVWASDMCPRLSESDRVPVHFDGLFRSAEHPEGFFDSLMDSPHGSQLFEVECESGANAFPARLRTTKMHDDNLNGTVVVAIFDDLSEQHRMENELRRNDRLRALGQMSAGVAHEIRNPLTGIATTAELLSSRLEAGDDRLRYVRTMLDEIHRLDGIIRNLLEFARPPKPQLAACSIRGVTDRVESLLGARAREKGVDLDIAVPEEIECRADAGQIAQVVLNVVLNAVQACEPGDRVSVATRVERGSGRASVARIDVTDTGPGIPAEVRTSLFDPFVTTKTRGTGLGLAISQHIMEEHNGSIRCEPLERGTRFTIELPFIEGDSARDDR